MICAVSYLMSRWAPRRGYCLVISLWLTTALLGAPAGFAQEDLVGRYVHVTGWQAALKAGNQTLGIVPDGAWLQIERVSGSSYLVTYRDAKGGTTQGWIHKDNVLLASQLTKEGLQQRTKSVELENQATALFNAGKYQDALSLYEETLQIRQRVLGDGHPEVATTLQNLGNTCNQLGKRVEAEKHFTAALAICNETLGDHPRTALCLNILATQRMYAGRQSEAEQLLRRSFKIREATLGKDHPDVAITLHRLSEMVRQLGRYHEAEQLARRSLEINETKLGKEHVATADSLSVLAELFRVTGRDADAEPLIRRAVEIQEAKLGKDHLTTVNGLTNLAGLYRSTGRYQDAEAIYRRCLEIREAKLGRDHLQVGFSLNQLGGVYREMGRYAEAEPLLRRSLEIEEARLGKDSSILSPVLVKLALLYQDTGRYGEAEPLWLRCLHLRETQQGKDNDFTTRIRNALAIMYARTDRETDARATFDQARRATRRFVTQLLPTLNQEQRRSYLQGQYQGSVADALADALSLGARQGQSDSATIEASAAWLANGKAVQQEAQAFATQLQSVDDPRARPVAEQLRKVREALTKLKLEPAGQGSEAERKKKMDLLEAEDRELTAQLQKLGGRTSRGVGWTELKAIRAALPAGGVLIDMARFEVNEFKKRTAGAPIGQEKPNVPHYVAWVTPQRGAVRVIDLGEAEAVDVLVADLQKELATAAKKMKEVGEAEAEKALHAKARALARRVLDPLLASEEVQNAKQWVLSPDSNLWLVPWAALPLADGKYVVEQYLLRMVSAGRDIAAASDPVGSSKVSAPVIVADPDFDLPRQEAARLARQVTSGGEPEDRGGSLLSQALTLGSVRRLPFTAAEAEMIAPRISQLARQEPRLFAEKQALEPVVKAARHPRLLVLSTHGFFLPEQQVNRDQRINEGESRAVVLTKEGKRFEEPLLRCGLLLAACNDQPKAGETRPGDDGVLTGLEVVGMDLRGCELVVLSACETGLGDVRHGEGVAGLRQAFQLAGAQAVVATLWQIDDRDSALLMSGFFDQLAKGRGKAEALREAQLARIKARRDRNGAAHPLFWAAFTLTGQDSG